MDKLADKKVIIVAGSGGVGKTTMSASLASSMAQAGKRVLVMTIDPAKRLVTALGLENLGVEPQKITSYDGGGSLFACMVDAKQIFDRFVWESVPSETEAQKIIKNRFYQQLSENLSGSQEFTSLQFLYSQARSGDFDIVILDTPPAKHARDFLAAPRKFYSLFDEKVLSWFTEKPQQGRQFFDIFRKGTTKAISVLESLVGKHFLAEIFEFFAAVDQIRPQIQSTSIEVQKMLTDSSTAFVLVTSPDAVKIQEAQNFAMSLHRESYHLACVIINRAYPLWINYELQANLFSNPVEMKLWDIYQKYLSFFTVQKSNVDGLQGSLPEKTRLVEVADLGKDVYNLSRLEELCQFLEP